MKQLLGARFQAVCLLCLVAGCGGGSDAWVDGREAVSPVTGRITLDGEPVEGAIIIVHSTTKDLSAQGRTDADGRYQLTTYEDNDGAVLGEHIVTVRKTEYTKTPTKFHTEEEPSYFASSTELLPEEAGKQETSDLRMTVTEDGATDVDFDF